MSKAGPCQSPDLKPTKTKKRTQESHKRGRGLPVCGPQIHTQQKLHKSTNKQGRPMPVSRPFFHKKKKVHKSAHKRGRPMPVYRLSYIIYTSQNTILSSLKISYYHVFKYHIIIFCKMQCYGRGGLVSTLADGHISVMLHSIE